LLLDGTNEASLRLCRLNPATGIFEAAGERDVGDVTPTGVLGDYGIDTGKNATWAEVDVLGTFAIGVPDPRPAVYLDPVLSLMFRMPVCGILWATSLCGTFAGLVGMKLSLRRRRRRW
jgi:hypothetical protein